MSSFHVTRNALVMQKAVGEEIHSAEGSERPVAALKLRKNLKFLVEDRMNNVLADTMIGGRSFNDVVLFVHCGTRGWCKTTNCVEGMRKEH